MLSQKTDLIVLGDYRLPWISVQWLLGLIYLKLLSAGLDCFSRVEGGVALPWRLAACHP